MAEGRSSRGYLVRYINAMIGAAVALSLLALPASAQPAPPREWTVMVYMNGKNNLEPDVLNNFHNMASVGSSSAVNIVVEMGRPSKVRYTSADGDWSGVLRFLVTRGMDPLPEAAKADVAKLGESTDMGKPETLQNFIRWAKRDYPAKRYMLVIWNHGQGWRFQLAPNKSHREAAARGRLTSAAIQQATAAKTPTMGGYRAVSSDDTDSILYNSEVQAVVAAEFADRPLDVLGFDACLIAMIETAYAFAPNVNVMVASEELELAAGWRYSDWLKALSATPKMSNEELGTVIVDAYQRQYGDDYLTTLSVIRLGNVRRVAGQLSSLADEILKAGSPELNAMRSSRAKLESYGKSVRLPLRTSVDIAALLENYEKLTKSQVLREHAKTLKASVQAEVLSNYASKRSSAPTTGLPYGSLGIAIYFPETLDAYYEDPWRSGYAKNNTDRPVAFVRSERWADLLYRILGVQ
jgi:hypothetical protein